MDTQHLALAELFHDGLARSRSRAGIPDKGVALEHAGRVARAIIVRLVGATTVVSIVVGVLGTSERARGIEVAGAVVLS